jgi:hypothetical protein
MVPGTEGDQVLEVGNTWWVSAVTSANLVEVMKPVALTYARDDADANRGDAPVACVSSSIDRWQRRGVHHHRSLVHTMKVARSQSRHAPVEAAPRGPVAQWLEQSAHNRSVTGSNPVGPTIVSASTCAIRAKATAVHSARCANHLEPQNCSGSEELVQFNYR